MESFLKESHGKTADAVAAMPNKITYKMLLAEGKMAYNNLKDRWGPTKAIKESAETALLAKMKALEAQVKQAIKPTPKGAGGGSKPGGKA